MEKLNKSINIKYTRIIIGALCVFGIVVEVMWSLSYLFHVMRMAVPIFSDMRDDSYLMDIFVSIIRLTILGAVLTVTHRSSQVYIRTQDLLVVRLLRLVGIGFVAFSFIGNATLDAAHDSLEAARGDYILNAAYFLLIGIEIYLLIRLLIKSREKIRTIYILEVCGMFAPYIMILILSAIDYGINSIGFVRYSSVIIQSVVSIIFIISYTVSIIMLLHAKDANDEIG